jgi:hypothetical protein
MSKALGWCRRAPFRVIKVKQSNYSGVDEELEKFLADADAKKIVAEPGGAAADYRRNPGLGVVFFLEARVLSFAPISIRQRPRGVRDEIAQPTLGATLA